MSFNLNINTKCENKSINICHLTRHLDCPSAPLGEVEPVRLGLVLGEDVGLDLVLGDPLGLVLGEEGFLGDGVSSAGAELKLESCRNSNMAAGWCL